MYQVDSSLDLYRSNSIMVFLLPRFFFYIALLFFLRILSRTPPSTTAPCVGHTASHPLLRQVCHHFLLYPAFQRYSLKKPYMLPPPFTPLLIVLFFHVFYLGPIFSIIFFSLFTSLYSCELFTLSLFSISPTEVGGQTTRVFLLLSLS